MLLRGRQEQAPWMDRRLCDAAIMVERARISDGPVESAAFCASQGALQGSILNFGTLLQLLSWQSGPTRERGSGEGIIPQYYNTRSGNGRPPFTMTERHNV